MTLIVKDPQELIDQGFSALPYDTIEGSAENLYWLKELEKWEGRLPGLREPRRPDGSGGSPPRPHQRRHACIALCRRHNFAAWGMGLGKSNFTLYNIVCLYGEQLFASMDWDLFDLTDAKGQAKMLDAARRKCTVRPGTIQIVAPRHILRQVWVRELARLGLDRFCEVIENESQLLNSRAPIFIYNYDFPKMQTDRGQTMRKAGLGLRIKETGRPYFLGHQIAKVIAKRRPPSLLILDEIHRLRSGSSRSEAMLTIRRRTKRVLGLTGTPMDGWVHHSATILGFIYGEQTESYPFTNEHFAKRFTKTKIVSTDITTGEETGGKERPVPGVNHMQIPSFLKATRHLIHRLNLTDDEVRANVVYPPVRADQILIEPDTQHLAFYKNKSILTTQGVNREFATASNAMLRTNMLALINDLRIASTVPHGLGYKGPTTRLTEQLVEIVKRHKAEGRKGLIGTTFINESRLLHEALQGAGLRGVRLYADDPNTGKKNLTPNDRELLVEKFQDDPDCWYLISNKELVAEGLNLSETASYTVSCSHGWRSNIEAQWLARVVRPGQTWTWVDCYTLLNKWTIDIYIYEMIRAKLEASAAMLDLQFNSRPTNGEGSIALDPVELARTLKTHDN